MLIAGVEVYKLNGFKDPRGGLVALDRNHGLPFDAKRIFYVFDCPEGTVRGQHSVSADMVLIALEGSVELDIDNGKEKLQLHLSGKDNAIFVAKGVWIRLHGFQPTTMLLVASASNYEDITYSKSPVPVHVEPAPQKQNA